MDISLNTIGYLMSDTTYKKISESKDKKNSNKTFIRDLKFYKKRIYQTTKDLIKYQIECKEFNKEVDGLLQHYLEELIEYFKFQDKTDILQNELSSVNKQVKFNIVKENSNFNADEFIMKKPEIKAPTIESCMKVNVKNQKTEKKIIPRSKNIDLKHPEFKTKGLKKFKK